MVSLRVVLALVIALTDDPAVASNILLIVLNTYIVILCTFKVYIKNIYFILNIISNISLISMGFLSRNIDDNNTSSFDGKLNSIGMMIILGFNFTIFVGAIAYHFYTYIIIARYKSRLTNILPRQRERRIETYQCEALDSDCEWREPLLVDSY